MYDDDRGVAAVEYGIIAALISCAVLVAVGSAGNGVGLVFASLASQLDTKPTSGPPVASPNAAAGGGSAP